MKNGLRAFDSGGVLEKFPNLRVAFLEGNCAWLPWLLYRRDERAKLQGPLADVPLMVTACFNLLMSELPQQFSRSTRSMSRARPMTMCLRSKAPTGRRPGFWVALAIARLPGMAPKLFNGFREHSKSFCIIPASPLLL